MLFYFSLGNFPHYPAGPNNWTRDLLNTSSIRSTYTLSTMFWFTLHKGDIINFLSHVLATEHAQKFGGVSAIFTCGGQLTNFQTFLSCNIPTALKS